MGNFKPLFLLIIAMLVLSPQCYADWNVWYNSKDGHHDGDHHDNDHHDGVHHDSGHDRDHHQDRDHHEDRDWHDHDRWNYVGFSMYPDSYYQTSYYEPEDQVLVSSSPAFQPVYINGTTYYVNNGSYYIYNGYGYESVVPPVVEQGLAPSIAGQPEVAGQTPDSITLNIPNDKGGYTTVTLRKSGTGYIGPQGEFYATFPSVAQLKVIYGK